MTTFTYCGETVDLSDAEIVALIRDLCGESGHAEEISMLRLTVVCDLGKGHPSLHASFQAEAWHNVALWFRWRGPVRDITRSVDAYCPEPGDDDHVDCLLFKGHPGPHCCLGANDPDPSWCGH
jgi:hypothetical protein